MQSRQRVPPRAAFVPHHKNLYGAINCANGTSIDSSAEASSRKGSSNRLKPSPPLIEIRKIKYSAYTPSDDSKQEPPRWSPFEHETLLVSRGIPGSVTSTCLDFAKSTSPTIRCATGLSSGALAVHSISNIHADSINSNIEHESNNLDVPTSTVTHYAPRQQRPSSSVAWRPSASGGNAKNSLVAIGLVGSSSAFSNTSSTSISKASSARVLPVSASSITSRSGITGSSISGGLSSTAGGSVGTGDRDFGCLVWDIEAQSSSVSGAGTLRGKTTAAGGRGSPPPPVGKGSVPIKSPVYRFAHNNGVESLSWLMDGQLLAVGCQKRNLQLYDLRMSGTNSAPISVFAHTDAVSGIASDDCCPTKTVFATFGRNIGEPVKLWDARMMDSKLGEIRVPSQYNVGISALAWSIERPGELSIAVGDSIRTFNTRSAGSRALPVNVSYVGDGSEECNLQCLAIQPQTQSTTNATKDQSGCYSRRILSVTSKGEVNLTPESKDAAVAISKRDGRIAHALGDTVWVGAATDGPAAMEGDSILINEDVSSRMMRRAICLHDVKYSIDARNNVTKLEEEKEKLFAQRLVQLSQDKFQTSDDDFSETLRNLEQLIHSWRWIALIELLSQEQKLGESSEEFWPAKGLIDAGVMKLLRMTSREASDNDSLSDNVSKSPTLFCDVYDSAPRKAAINACGWVKKYGDLKNLLDQCQSSGEFERSAALALWHGDLGESVAALQRGAEEVKALYQEKTNDTSEINTLGTPESYRETLSLIAMCVAGFNVTTDNDGMTKTSNIWSSACEGLLRRVSETNKANQSSGAVYLRAILLFLQNIGKGFDSIIENEGILLGDRVAFACKFLPRKELRSFLDTNMRKCLRNSDLTGLVITGLDKRGISLLQSYVDRYADVQTAALISSRIILPAEWNNERKICHEWLESYRMMLNNLQMWHNRAAFDCGRCDLIRNLKGNATNPPSGRRAATKKQHDNKNAPQTNFPPQIWARCNYCNASLPLAKLRRQEGIANSWLSRQNPVLTCCPTCKKPLPRCSICLLSLGCLNPYMELQRERNQYPRNASSMDKRAMTDDLSGLANIPFAEWFTWCMKCKHGGHAHHLVGWFSKHTSCPVSGCDCQCQFDGIEKLRRPGLHK